MMVLKNTTGRRRGQFIYYLYGQDLFGFFYLDVIRAQKHLSAQVKSELFARPQDLICAIDMDLERREQSDYLPCSV